MRERCKKSATQDAALATSGILSRIFLFLVARRNIALRSTWSVLARDEILSRKIDYPCRIKVDYSRMLRNYIQANTSERNTSG